MEPGHQRIAALCLLGLLVFWQPRLTLNDDIAQAAGLWSLADGHLGVRVADLPDSFDPFLEGRYRHFSFSPDDNATTAPFGSTPLNLLALPGLLLLRATALAVGDVAGLSFIGAILAGLAVYVLARARQPATAPAWGFATGLLFALGMARGNDTTLPYLEIAALQLVNLAAAVGTALLVWDLARRFTNERAATWVALIVGWGTPVAFWAMAGKYHALATFLTLLAVWLYREGPITSPRRTAAGFLVAGLAVWNSVPFGVITGLSLVVLALPVVRLPRAQMWPRVGAIAGVGLVGLLPEIAQRLLGGGGQYLPELGRSSVAYIFDPNSPVGWLAHTVFTEPAQTVVGLGRILAWPDIYRTGSALPLLATVPLFLLAVKGIRAPHWPRPLRRAILTVLAVHIALFGGMLDAKMLGPDARYLSGWWPLLALLAAPAIAQWLEASRATARSVASQSFALAWSVAGAVFVTHLLHGWIVDYGPAFELVWPWRLLGLAVAALVVAGIATSKRWPGLAATTTHLAVSYGFALQVSLSLGIAFLTFDAQPSWAFWPMDFVAGGVHWLAYAW